MNFSSALQGHLSRSGAINAIQDQAETELNRRLNKDEIASLSSNFSPINLIEMIQKVSLIPPLFFSDMLFFSMAMVT